MHEEEDSMICSEVLHLSDGQDREPKAVWQALAFRGFHVEIRIYHHGFYHQITQDS